MAKAEIEETLSVSPEQFFKAVVRYEDYPQFVDGCKKVSVKRSDGGKARVTYDINMMKEISYTLDHVESPEKGSLKWSLVSSDFLKKNVGEWTIQSAGPGQCKVRYVIDIEFSIPVPSLILGRLVKSSLPSMVRSFEKQAKKL